MHCLHVSNSIVIVRLPPTKESRGILESHDMVQQLAEALRMLDTFASVGATHFDLTHTSIDGEKRGFRPGQSLTQLKNSMPKLFPGAAERQNNIIVRPTSDKVHFVQLDDLDVAGLERVGEAAFLTLRTSPGNHQAWVAISRLPSSPQEAKDFARRLRKGTGADATASGATRVAGTTNYKRKYEPEFPIVTIRDTAPGRIMTAGQLEALQLVAPPDPITVLPSAAPARVSRRSEAAILARKWPDYDRCLQSAPPNHGNTGPDSSRADFTWCMTALDWGFDIPETTAKLMEVSGKAKENGPRYAALTAQNASAAVEKKGQKTGRG
jgi:RepB DNA-primase from phage plasmid